MSNDLNTVLIEGKVVRISEIDAEKKCELAVKNERQFIDPVSGEWKTTSTTFPVIVVGPVADACVKYLKKGRRIRAVGRLVKTTKNCILAEHLEFSTKKEA